MAIDELDAAVKRVQSERAAADRRAEAEQKRAETEARTQEREREDARVKDLIIQHRDARANVREREADLAAVDGKIAVLGGDAPALWQRWRSFCGSPAWNVWRQNSYIIPTPGYAPDVKAPPPGFTAAEMTTLRAFEPLVKARETANALLANARERVRSLEAELPELSMLAKE